MCWLYNDYSFTKCCSYEEKKKNQPIKDKVLGTNKRVTLEGREISEQRFTNESINKTFTFINNKSSSDFIAAVGKKNTRSKPVITVSKQLTKANPKYPLTEILY